MWQLQAILSKTSVVHLNANNPHVSYSFNNAIIIVCAESIRDLSVIVDSGLMFNAHVYNVVSKAYARIAMILRGFSTRNASLLCCAYITYVRPIH